MAVEIVEPGLGCTLQDRGRPGYYNVGIPPSGAVDMTSALAANLLVGNEADAPVIEAPYLGPRLRFTEPAVVAVTGATMEPRLNNEPVPAWQSFEAVPGDELSFGFLPARRPDLHCTSRRHSGATCPGEPFHLCDRWFRRVRRTAAPGWGRIADRRVAGPRGIGRTRAVAAEARTRGRGSGRARPLRLPAHRQRPTKLPRIGNGP